MTEKEKKAVLKRFMKEFFHYPTLLKAGLFTKEMKGDYESQAKRICEFFGYETVYQYRATETRCHLSIGDGPVSSKSVDEFVTVLQSIYE